MVGPTSPVSSRPALLRQWLLRLALALLAVGAIMPPVGAVDRAATPGLRTRHAVPAPVWRPRWWPRAMPAGTGRAGIVIRLRQQRLYLHDGRKLWTHFPISTGADYSTPQGWYRVVSKVRRPSWTYNGMHVPGGVAENPLGVCWLGLGMPRWWRGAPIGMHGTNAPWLIGRPVSRGCIRMRNRDALKLYRTVPVGCPVWIRP